MPRSRFLRSIEIQSSQRFVPLAVTINLRPPPSLYMPGRLLALTLRAVSSSFAIATLNPTFGLELWGTFRIQQMKRAQGFIVWNSDL